MNSSERYDHENSIWRKAVGSLPTPMTAVMRAQGPGADAMESRMFVIRRYKTAMIGYLTEWLVRNTDASDPATAMPTAVAIFAAHIHRFVDECLQNPPKDYTIQPFRDQLCEWVHRAYHKVTNPQSITESPPNWDLWNQKMNSDVLEDALHCFQEINPDDHLIVMT